MNCHTKCMHSVTVKNQLTGVAEHRICRKHEGGFRWHGGDSKCLWIGDNGKVLRPGDRKPPVERVRAKTKPEKDERYDSAQETM